MLRYLKVGRTVGTRYYSTVRGGRSLGSYLSSPTTPILFVLGVVASELMSIINTRNERDRTVLKAETKISLLKSLIQRVNSGENVDVKKELSIVSESSSVEKTFEQIMKELEEADDTWVKTKRPNQLDQLQEPEPEKSVLATQEPTTTTPSSKPPSNFL
jgi:hypothetical protein